MEKQAYVRILIFILFLGLLLRLYNLDTEGFWTDEAFSVLHAGQPSLALVVAGVAQTEAAPPGYYVLLHYWMQSFGNTVFIIRLLSVIFSVLAVVMLFLLVRLLSNTKVALLASLFMSITMLQIEYAQEARMYALFTFLSLASAYFFARWYKKEDNNSLWWYGFLVLLAMYVNYMAVFLLLGYTFILFSKKENFQLHGKRWFFTHIIISVLCLPLLPILFSQFQILNQGLSDTLIRKGLPALFANLGIFFFLLPIAGFTILAAVIISQKKVKNIFLWLDTYFFLFILLVGSAYLYLSRNPLIISGIPLIRVPLTNSYFLVRHSFFLVPLWYVYLGHKVDQWWQARKRVLAISVLLLILFFSFSSLLVYYAQPTKAQWQEATAFISTSSGTEPLILLDKGGFSNEFLLRYYYPGNFTVVKLTWLAGGRNPQQMPEAGVLEKLKGEEEFWLVLAKNNDGKYKNFLDEHYRNDIFREFYGIKVFHYTVKERYFFPIKY